MVISAQGDEYQYLIGSVLEINLLGAPDHDTENTTDDVHVDFSVMAYPGRRRKKISKAFSAAYSQKKAFRDCPVDDVIMDPGRLIRITGIDGAALQRLLAAEENAKWFCDGFQYAVMDQKTGSKLEKPLPDGSKLIAETRDEPDYPGIRISPGKPDGADEFLCFAEYNTAKTDGRQLCVCAYACGPDEPAYYESYSGTASPGPNV